MRKIALWRTIGDSFGFLFSDLQGFVALSGGWILALAGICVLAAAAYVLSSLLAFLIFIAGVVVFYFGGLLSFTVGWHRAVLLHERRSVALEFGAREWRFFGYMVLVGLANFAIFVVPVLLTAIVAGVIAGIAQTHGGAVQPVAAGRSPLVIVDLVIEGLVALVCFAYAIRFTLVFPAVAVDERGQLFRTAWRRGKGNGWRLLAGEIICALPVYIVQIVLSLLHIEPAWQTILRLREIPNLPYFTTLFVGAIVFLVLYFAQAALTIGFLSFSYRQLADPSV